VCTDYLLGAINQVALEHLMYSSSVACQAAGLASVTAVRSRKEKERKIPATGY
jgi:hypothetical protein